MPSSLVKLGAVRPGEGHHRLPRAGATGRQLDAVLGAALALQVVGELLQLVPGLRAPRSSRPSRPGPCGSRGPGSRRTTGRRTTCRRPRCEPHGALVELATRRRGPRGSARCRRPGRTRPSRWCRRASRRGSPRGDGVGDLVVRGVPRDRGDLRRSRRGSRPRTPRRSRRGPRPRCPWPRPRWCRWPCPRRWPPPDPRRPRPSESRPQAVSARLEMASTARVRVAVDRMRFMKFPSERNSGFRDVVVLVRMIRSVASTSWRGVSRWPRMSSSSIRAAVAPSSRIGWRTVVRPAYRAAITSSQPETRTSSADRDPPARRLVTSPSASSSLAQAKASGRVPDFTTDVPHAGRPRSRRARDVGWTWTSTPAPRHRPAGPRAAPRRPGDDAGSPTKVMVPAPAPARWSARADAVARFSALRESISASGVRARSTSGDALPREAVQHLVGDGAAQDDEPVAAAGEVA